MTIDLINACVVNIEEVKADFSKQWEAAGIEKVKNELQRQVDAFIASKKK